MIIITDRRSRYRSDLLVISSCPPKLNTSAMAIENNLASCFNLGEGKALRAAARTVQYSRVHRELPRFASVTV